MRDDRDEVGDAVYQLLSALDRTSLTYLIADLCQIQGWATEVTTGDLSTSGDLVTRRILPYPHSVIISNHTDSKLDEGSLQELLSESIRTNETRYTVVVTQQPTERALDVAEEHNIGILALGDLVEEILVERVVELVLEYAKEDEKIVSEYEDLLLLLDDGGHRIEDESRTERAATDVESPERPRNRPLSENGRLSLGLVGYDTYVPDDESPDGLLVAVKLTAKEDLQLAPEDFSLEFEDGTEQHAVGEAESTLVGRLSGILEPEWTVGDVSLTGGESCRYFLYVPTSTESPPAALSLEDVQLALQPPLSSQTFRGLPGPIVDVLDDLLGSTLTEGHQESYISYGLDEQPADAEERSDGVTATNDLFSLRLVGYQYVESDASRGVLLGVEIESVEHDLRVEPDEFELHSTDRFTYSGADPSEFDVTSKVADGLPQTWKTGKASVSGGGRINYLLFFPTDGRPDFAKLRRSVRVSDTLRIPNREVEDETGHMWADTISLEFTVADDDRMRYHGSLPEPILDAVPPDTDR